MKKILMVVFVLAVFIGFTALSFAQGAKTSKVAKTDVIRGEIVSIDSGNNQIVVKETNTGVQKTIAVEPKTIVSLKVGEHVKVKVKSDSNKAESVTAIQTKKGKK